MSSLGNRTALFDAFAGGVTDKLAIVFKRIGAIGFAGVPLGLFLSNIQPTSQLWAWVTVVGFFLGPIMFICFAARAIGIQKGISGFGRQFWGVFRKTILYLLLPALLITAAMALIMAHNHTPFN